MGKERVEKIIKESRREKEGESWPDLGKEWRGKEESGLFVLSGIGNWLR